MAAKLTILFLLFTLSAFGQAFTLKDPAFMGNVSKPISSGSTITWSAVLLTNPCYQSTFTYPVGAGNNRLLMVGYTGAYVDPASVGFTYHSAPLTFLTCSTNTAYFAYLFYLVNPDVGSYNVEGLANCNTSFHVLCFYGVNQSTPFGTIATNSNTYATSASITNTSASGQQVMDGLVTYYGIAVTADASQTVLSSASGFGMSLKPGAASTVLSWSWGGDGYPFNHVSVSIKPAP